MATEIAEKELTAVTKILYIHWIEKEERRKRNCVPINSSIN